LSAYRARINNLDSTSRCRRLCWHRSRRPYLAGSGPCPAWWI